MRYTFLLLAILLSSTCYVKAQIPAHIPSVGLIGYWPFDSSALNHAGTAHHGSTNAVTNTNNRFGQPAKAYYLDGSTSFITLPATAMQQVSGAFTVSIWARSDTFVPSATGHEIINDRTSATWPYRFRIGFAYANNTIFNVDSAYFDRIAANGTIQKVGSAQPSFDGWEHYVFVYDFPTASTASIQAYRNGQLVGSTPAPTAVTGARNINIGRTFFPGGPSNGLGYFKGSVDDVCLWSRALTAAEIQTLYAECSLAIQAQPSDQAVGVGANVSFQVTAPTVSSYLWQIDSSANGNWQALGNGPVFSGVNTPTLTVSGVQRSLAGARFRCFMSTGTCSGYSNTALLEVNCQQLINQQPISTSQFVGSQASFQINSTINGLQYQWQTLSSGNFVSLQNLGQYSGVNTPNLQVSTLSLVNNGQLFRCLVTGLGCNDTSVNVVLTVNCLPLITQQPVNDTVSLQQTAQFFVNPSSSSATYQWYQNSGLGFVALSNAGQYTGVTTSQMQMSNVQLINNNTAFRCIVNDNNCADTSATAFLTVINNVSVPEYGQLRIQVYPNPAKEQITLVLGESRGPEHLQIFNLLGSLQFEARLDGGKHLLSIANWPAGTYVIRVGNASTRLVVLP